MRKSHGQLAQFRKVIMYDLIGDVHGHADELVDPLQTLGYRWSGEQELSPANFVTVLG